MRQIALYIALIFLVFYFLDHAFKSAPPAPECPVAINDSDSAKRKFEEIAHTDYEDYLKLKSDADKYKKADEILQKIAAIFVADLGIHLKEKPNTSPTPIPSSSPIKKVAMPVSNAPAPSASKPALYAPVVQSELRNINNPTDEAVFLQKESFTDPKQGLFSAQEIQALDPNLKGCFTGNVVFSDQHVGQDIKLWIGDVAGGPTIRSFKMLTLQNGKVFHHSSGNTQNIFLTNDASDKNEFIFYPSVGKYFQLFYAGGSQLLIGNEYEQQPDSNYLKKGLISLKKTADCSWITQYTFW